MDYPEKRKDAELIAQDAITLMANHGVTPHPRNYALVYSYCSGRDKELVQALDVVFAERRPHSDDVLRRLYDQFFSSQDESEVVASATQRMERTLEQMVKTLSVASKGTASYNKTLKDFSEHMDAADPKALESLVTTVMKETQRVRRINETMAQELKRSSGEIHSLREDLDKVRQEALTDALTGIANRKVFDTRILEQTDQANTDRSFLSLLMLDIDHFKHFNDTFGHPMGDQVLKLVARVIRQGVKGKDVAARYGGEEFSVILPQTRLRDAVGVGEAIRRAVANKRVTNKRTGDDLGTVTLSIGVSEFRHGETIAQFVQRADEALYMAKRGGRNRVMSQLDLDLSRMSGMQQAS